MKSSNFPRTTRAGFDILPPTVSCIPNPLSKSAENAARDRLDALVDYFSAYPHGGAPRFPIFPYAMRSSFTLVAHLVEIHPTRHLDAARDSARNVSELDIWLHTPPEEREVSVTTRRARVPMPATKSDK